MKAKSVSTQRMHCPSLSLFMKQLTSSSFELCSEQLFSILFQRLVFLSPAKKASQRKVGLGPSTLISAIQFFNSESSMMEMLGSTDRIIW